MKFGIFAKFEMTFDGIEKLRKYSDFIESIAFLKNACDERITPILNEKNELVFLYKEEYINEKNISDVLDSVKEAKTSELKKITNEIKRLYEDIEETDNKIKDRKQEIKNMEVKIREVQEASGSIFSSIRYLTFTHNNSIANKIKRIFKKEQLKLNA